jgi:hypothetical protein
MFGLQIFASLEDTKNGQETEEERLEGRNLRLFVYLCEMEELREQAVGSI